MVAAGCRSKNDIHIVLLVAVHRSLDPMCSEVPQRVGTPLILALSNLTASSRGVGILLQQRFLVFATATEIPACEEQDSKQLP